MSRKGNDELKELRAIKNLLILSLLKEGATSEEINLATKMGAGNIRGMFPRVRTKGRGTHTEPVEETKADVGEESP
jgi:hypothetical protein